MHRLFIAIDPPDEHKERIGSICYGLPGTRWVPEEQVHLTLRFIGEVDGSCFRQIVDQLAEVEADPFDLTIRGTGHFPPRRTPRVLWLGLDRSDALLNLRGQIESSLQKIGLKPEGRKFSPHITIARFRNPSLEKTASFMAGHNLFELPPFRVVDFNLYSSQLKADGAIHTIEASFPLG